MISAREIESRSTPSPVEARKSLTGRSIGGYAARFGQPSRDLGGFLEVVERQAFAKTEGDGWPGVVARFDHKSELLLGTTASGTLELHTDAKGLDYTVECPDTTAGNDVLALTARKDIRHSSFAFQVYDAEFTYGDEGIPVRHLTSVRLIDCSPCVIPAYPDATVGLRSLALQFGEDPEDIFKLARDNELRRLFCRTDLSPRRTGRQALIELMASSKDGVTHYKPLTPARMKAQLTRMMMPQPTKSMAERRAELTRLAAASYETASSIGLDG